MKSATKKKALDGAYRQYVSQPHLPVVPNIDLREIVESGEPYTIDTFHGHLLRPLSVISEASEPLSTTSSDASSSISEKIVYIGRISALRQRRHHHYKPIRRIVKTTSPEMEPSPLALAQLQKMTQAFEAATSKVGELARPEDVVTFLEVESGKEEEQQTMLSTLQG